MLEFCVYIWWFIRSLSPSSDVDKLHISSDRFWQMDTQTAFRIHNLFFIHWTKNLFSYIHLFALLAFPPKPPGMRLSENKCELKQKPVVKTFLSVLNKTMLPCFHQELTEELGELEASSDEEAMVTTRVVRRRVIIQVIAVTLLHVRDTSVPITLREW